MLQLIFLKSLSKVIGIGNDTDFKYYKNIEKNIYDAILKEYFSENGRLTVTTQTTYVLALNYNIYKPNCKDKIIE